MEIMFGVYTGCEEWMPCLSARTVVFNLGYAKTSYINQNETQNRLNLEPALILAFTKIHPRNEVLACQKQAQ
jgi:hypothetical protein